MGIVNEQKFIEQATTAGIGISLHDLEYSGLSVISPNLHSYPSIPRSGSRTLLNEGQARELYAKIRETYTSSGWLSKSIRPWTLVPSVIPSMNEPLIGFEFETSPSGSRERLRIKQELWDTFENYSLDPEGGLAGLEVTFSPEPLSAYTSGTSNAQRFAREVLSTMELESYHESETDIGTHANISIPGIPAMVVVQFINNSLSSMPAKGEDGTDLRLALFGRSELYGIAYNQGKYVEMKTFRTTYDPQVLALYIERIVNLINGIKLAATEYGVTVIAKACINLFDVMMTGAAPIMEAAPDTPPFSANTGQDLSRYALPGDSGVSDLSSLDVSFHTRPSGCYGDNDDEYGECEDGYDDDGYCEDDDDDYF